MSSRIDSFTAHQVKCRVGSLGQGGAGKLRNPQNAGPGWNVTRFAAASVDMYADIVPGDATMCDMQDCKPKPGHPGNCSTPATICRAALARLPEFIDEVKQVLTLPEWSLKGFHFDWEYGCGNDIPCHQELWGAVSKAIRPLGKHLAFSVDDSHVRTLAPSVFHGVTVVSNSSL